MVSGEARIKKTVAIKNLKTEENRSLKKLPAFLLAIFLSDRNLIAEFEKDVPYYFTDLRGCEPVVV